MSFLTIRGEHELLRLMANLLPGSEAGVKLTHPGWGERVLQVNVGDMPDDSPQTPVELTAAEAWGITVYELSAEAAHEADVSPPQALVVTDIIEGSPADVGGL